jgi:hypothetical protein
MSRRRKMSRRHVTSWGGNLAKITRRFLGGTEKRRRPTPRKKVRK